MKVILFSLSLLLLLEKPAAGIGIYGGTKGQFVAKTSPLVFIQKDQFLYDQKEAQEDGPEESIFVQTKHHAYSQDADADADMGETQSSQEQTSLKEDTACDEEDKIAQQKAQLQSWSQIKSEAQVKSHGAQLKSQTGQLKILGQVKSEVKLKPQAARLKSYQAPVYIKKAFLQQTDAKGYALHEDLAQVHLQHKKVHSLKRKLGHFRKIAVSSPQFRQQPQAYDGFILQFQGQVQGGGYTKSFHQAQGTCYCPKEGLLLYQGAFTG
ncbi:seminal vesicle secretory protein 3A-like [Acomys russatus]|uniref:seminal vesicle secretory protein 3A-like n=1 Tax=Acomys russatus TaxID=60746 RepID=UPI0021E2BE54|nr:seminal vesicle secretory protein 3A-like [Acomys russatus]